MGDVGAYEDTCIEMRCKAASKKETVPCGYCASRKKLGTESSRAINLSIVVAITCDGRGRDRRVKDIIEHAEQKSRHPGL